MTQTGPGGYVATPLPGSSTSQQELVPGSSGSSMGFTPNPTAPGGGAPLSGAGPTPWGIQPNTMLGTKPLTWENPTHPNYYISGDEWALIRAPTQDIGEIQMKLVAAGYLREGQFAPGVWDQGSASALSSVMAQANVYGANYNDMLDVLAQRNAAATKAPASLRRIANPLVSQQAIYNANLSLTGNYATPQETSQFQSWYQQQVQQAYQDYQSAGGPNSGMYFAAPSVSDAANAYVQSHNQAQVQGFATASRMVEFYKLMGVQI